jgi:hypothetical protein
MSDQPVEGLCLHSTTQHRNTKKHIHLSRGTETRDPSNQAVKPYALDRAVTGTAISYLMSQNVLKSTKSILNDIRRMEQSKRAFFR